LQIFRSEVTLMQDQISIQVGEQGPGLPGLVVSLKVLEAEYTFEWLKI